ncbi:MAG TPA: DUF2157 domain-containing protein [Nocardioidaceae bacterium]|nr:DUF2157 domain-containing protein [Nocardioidaceae bacterium]
MTANVHPATGPARPATPGQLAWLDNELAVWRSTGIVDDRQATAIRQGYVEVRRFSLAKLLLFLGGGFVGVGLIWLVATNLDELPPLLRFALVTILWLGLVVSAEVLAGRRAHQVTNDDRSSPVVGALRLLAALGFGAVIFQAAQSLQVPAYEPGLVGFWGLGALVYAYAVGGVTPLLVGVAGTTTWFVWDVFAAAEDGMGFVLPVLLAGVVAAGAAVLHAHRRSTLFAAPWREASALLVLLGLFIAAFPYVDVDGFTWSLPTVLGLIAALAVAGASTIGASATHRAEALVPLAAVAAGVLLVLWEPPEPVGGTVGAEGLAHALISVAVYVTAAGWFAILGVLRDSTRLTVIATGALVLFTTVQSFAVFAPIVTGASLFLLLGVVLLGSGYLFDRGRRRLATSLEGASA